MSELQRERVAGAWKVARWDTSYRVRGGGNGALRRASNEHWDYAGQRSPARLELLDCDSMQGRGGAL